MKSNEYYKLMETLHRQTAISKIEMNEESINEILQELDIYHAELSAQNDQLIEKEQKLIDSNKEYELFFYDAPIAYLIIDKSFLIKRYNKKADTFLNISVTYIPNNTLFTFIQMKYLESFLKWISNEEYLHKPIEINLKLPKKDIRRFKIYGNNYPLNNHHILLSLVDIQEEYLLKNDLQTQVKIKTEENLKQNHILQQQSKLAVMGEMIANIAHQWRQPLNILSAHNIDLILKYKNDNLKNEDINTFSSKSQKLIEKMSNTIESFVNFFNPDKEKKLFKISELVNECLILIENDFIKNNITLSINYEKEILYKGYRNELEQVILIILNNSKDSILSNKKNGKIDITISKVLNNYINLEIIDNGGNIEKKIIDRVFEPYFTTKHKSSGTGIGLYMSKMIIEQSMNGSINIKNLENGVKTTIKLPLDD